MRVMRSIPFLLAAGLAVSACQTPTGGFPNFGGKKAAITPAKPAIDGQWVPTDPANAKIYYNEFTQGRFKAMKADGSATLAAGSYTSTENGADFKYFSATRNREVSAKCTFKTTNLLGCVLDDGTNLDLQRRTQPAVTG